MDDELEQVIITQTKRQLAWVDSVIERYLKLTGKTITRSDIITRVLFHGFAGAENEMRAIEAGLGPKVGPNQQQERKKIKHLTLLD